METGCNNTVRGKWRDYDGMVAKQFWFVKYDKKQLSIFYLIQSFWKDHKVILKNKKFKLMSFYFEKTNNLCLKF